MAAIGPDHLIDTILRRDPALIAVLLRHGMRCTGCTMAPFETVGDVAAAYGVPLAKLLADLNAAGAAGEAR